MILSPSPMHRRLGTLLDTGDREEPSDNALPRFYSMMTRKRMALLVPVLLVFSGILWGWLLFSTVHIVPRFYLIAPAVDIAAFGVVGVWLHRRIRRHVYHESLRTLVGGIAMTLFYTGERVILFGWILGVWPFDSGSAWISRMHLAWELSVVIVGLAAVQGLWDYVHRLRHSATKPR